MATIRCETVTPVGRRAAAVIVALGALVGAACNSDDDTSSTDTITASGSTAPGTTAPPTTPAATPGSDPDESPVDTVAEDVAVLDFEFQPVPAGRYRVETIGAPFVIDIPEGWFVQPNSFGHFVITDPESTGPGDRDIVMIRPSNIADPDQPGAPVEEQDGDWPLDDISGWLEALIPGVVDGDAVETTIGGLDAVRFDVAVGDDVDCGDEFCVGFATNREVNSMWFDPDVRYRVWWIDGGDESPIAVNIGAGSDAEFTERAQAVLDTVVFESIGPNPVPAEGNLWELGLPSEVPAGEVNLPVGPGIAFEMSESHVIVQDGPFAGVLLEGPGEVDVFFPDLAFDGAEVATVGDVVDAIERDPDLTGVVVGSRDVGGYDATEIEISSDLQPGDDGPPPPRFLWSGGSEDEGWLAPPNGILWVADTPDGVVVVTAEWFEPSAEADAQELATEILDSITIGG